jgi:hypothetical protein
VVYDVLHEQCEMAAVLVHLVLQFVGPAHAMYVLGGYNGGFDDLLSSSATVDALDAQSGAWFNVAPTRTARASFGACVLDGYVYAVGGRTTGECAVATVERLDPIADCWRSVAPMLVPRRKHGVCELGGFIYAIGGYGNGERSSSSYSSAVAASAKRNYSS